MLCTEIGQVLKSSTPVLKWSTGHVLIWSYHGWLFVCHADRQLLQGVSIACYASPVLVIVVRMCLSVCLSVTRCYCIKTTQAMITKSSLTDSPRTPKFLVSKVDPEIREGSPRVRALNESRLGKIQFSANKAPYLRNSAR